MVPLHTAHLLSEVSLLPQFAVKWCPSGGPCQDRKGEVGAEGRGRGRHNVNIQTIYRNFTIIHPYVYNGNHQCATHTLAIQTVHEQLNVYILPGMYNILTCT